MMILYQSSVLYDIPFCTYRMSFGGIGNDTLVIREGYKKSDERFVHHIFILIPVIHRESLFL